VTEQESDMIIQPLRDLIEAASPPKPLPYRQQGQRSMKEVVKSIEENRWTPPPGAKSSLEMLREDRDR